jgi:hypothetical protein
MIKIHGDPLLYTTMCLQLTDQTLCYPKGILEDVWIVVGHSYVLADFVIVETGGDEKAPIILGWLFLSTTKAIIYADSAKICFTINGRKERFNFKKRTLNIRVHPQTLYLYKDTTAPQQRRRTRIGEGETKLSIRQKKQYGWSTLLIQNLTTSFHQHTSLNWEILEYPPSIVWSREVLSTRRSVTSALAQHNV